MAFTTNPWTIYYRIRTDIEKLCYLMTVPGHEERVEKMGNVILEDLAVFGDFIKEERGE